MISSELDQESYKKITKTRFGQIKEIETLTCFSFANIEKESEIVKKSVEYIYIHCFVREIFESLYQKIAESLNTFK